MTVHVLESRSEIDRARKELERRGLSCLSPLPLRILRASGLIRGVSVGDYIKSWDVLQTARFIEDHVPRSAPVLDIGAYASEILCVLHRLQYSALRGVDLNPKVALMPHAGLIRYEVANFLRTPFQDESFCAITAISVIEHGLDSRVLLSEVSRLLSRGGCFIASFDYWPKKIDTTGVRIFGLDWQILSEAEVVNLIHEAQEVGLSLCGTVSLHAEEPIIRWAGRSYTFAWLALRKVEADHRPRTHDGR